MKKLMNLMVLLLPLCATAQKEDYVWLFGYINGSHQGNYNAGGCQLDFNYTPADTALHIRLADFEECNVSYCDRNGQLMFYSNCSDVFDARDSIMEGGDTINPGQEWKDAHQNQAHRYSGLFVPQGVLAMPSPNDSSHYFLFHFALRLANSPSFGTYISDTMFSSEINMTGNFGFGQVEEKNRIITYDSLYGTEMSAVKHGNGKYWWIIKPYFIGDKYYKFLLDDSGIHLHDVQSIGIYREGWGNIGYSCFSNKGDKYFSVNATDGILMFDFDRCSGQLSNQVRIPYPHFATVNDSIILAGGAAVSPNDRFLYVSCTGFVLQYDLQAADIGASVDTVAYVDSFLDPYPCTFYMQQLGPDGKIYISSTNGVKSLHVINRPDEKGDSCLFAQHGVELPTFNLFSMPNFPNYRLGALQGSACDTLTGLDENTRAEKEKIIKIFPNPATTQITVDYGFTDWNKAQPDLEITNSLGQVVYQQKLPMYSGYKKIDVNNYPAGAYAAFIKRNGKVVAVEKFVKE